MEYAARDVHPAVLFGCQHLASAVLKQAIADALDPSVAVTLRCEARQFLAGSDDYRFWCQMGGFDPRLLLRCDQ